MTDLKPCPFCGRNVKFEQFGGAGGAIVCIYCDIFVGTQLGDIENVISVWNKRVSE